MITFIENIDQTLLFFIQTFHYPILDKIMIIITTSGNRGMIWLLVSFILIVNKKTRIIGLLTILSLAFAYFWSDEILKNLFARPRPYTTFPGVSLLIDQTKSYAFPSGHTTSSFAAAYVLNRYLKKYALISWLTAALIAFSRLYLFMHYPSDILAGIVLGLICGKTVTYIYEHRFNKNSIS